MSERNDPVSEKSAGSKGTMVGANGASVSSPSNNNSKKIPDQENLRDKKPRKTSEKRRKNQMPSKKRSGGNGFVLSKEDIYYLKTHTRYDEKEIK